MPARTPARPRKGKQGRLSQLLNSGKLAKLSGDDACQAVAIQGTASRQKEGAMLYEQGVQGGGQTACRTPKSRAW